MNKSVSATDLAKMLYCEASVTQKASITSLDMLRINKGKAEHKRFEHKLRTLTGGNIKVMSLQDIKVNTPTTNLTIPNAHEYQGNNTKERPLTNIIAAAIIVSAVVTFYLLSTR